MSQRPPFRPKEAVDASPLHHLLEPAASPSAEPLATAAQVATLQESIDRLERKIALIFGDAVVINGRFAHTGGAKG